MKEFDYYIFVDSSEDLLGYLIIDNSRLNELLPKISKFMHYRALRNKSAYIHSIKKRIERDKIKDYFFKSKIKQVNDSPEIYSDLAVFLKNHSAYIVFISIDDRQYKNFERFVQIIDGQNTKLIKEGQLKKGSKEHKLSLVLDTLLNIERLKIYG